MKVTGTHKAPTEVLTYCRRLLMQAVWEKLLSGDFKNSYSGGCALTCGDGVVRRVYPRIFAYSADYPEKSVIYFLSFLD